jgi:predicted AAA+ superfamily ATPase
MEIFEDTRPRPRSLEELKNLMDQVGYQDINHIFGNPVRRENFLDRPELHTTVELLQNGKDVYLHGAARSGKSSILLNLEDKYPGETVFIDCMAGLSMYSEPAKIDPDELEFYTESLKPDAEQAIILIDEAEPGYLNNVPDLPQQLEPAIKKRANLDRSKHRYILAGSRPLEQVKQETGGLNWLPKDEVQVGDIYTAEQKKNFGWEKST